MYSQYTLKIGFFQVRIRKQNSLQKSCFWDCSMGRFLFERRAAHPITPGLEDKFDLLHFVSLDELYGSARLLDFM